MRFFLILLFCLVPFLFLSGCEKKVAYECKDPIGCVTIYPGEPIKIGVLQPLTGRLKDSGTVSIRSIEIALLKRDNKLLGHPVKLEIEDSQCSPEGGGNAALKLVADPKIVAIIGTNCSGAATTASRIMSKAGLVMISGTNSASSLTSIGGKPGADWHPGYFRTMANSIGRGSVAAEFAFRELKLAKAATIHDRDKRSMELVELFEKTFQELGGKITMSAVIDRGDKNMRPMLERMADTGTQFIFMPVFSPEADLIAIESDQTAGLENIKLMVSGSSMRTDAFIQSIGSAGTGMFFISAVRHPSGTGRQQFLEAYQKRFRELPSNQIFDVVYDAANILLSAIEAAVTKEEDGTLHIGRQALRDAMYATAGFEGTTGRLTCDEFGDCATPLFNILRLDDPTKGLAGLLTNEVYVSKL